ncbi:MAG: thiolase family protein [Alphaproteobacteria bacterium]|nr:thiolase family protein [Alphaproteobacteria bacterium]
MKNVVIAGYVRSPFQFARKGQLAKVRPDEMAGQVVRALVQRTGIEPKDVEDVIMGCAFPEGEQGFNVARIVGFIAGLPINVAGTTVNRFCGSSMQAIHMAAGAIQMDAGHAFICAGIESMTRIPMAGFNPAPHPALYKEHPDVYMAMGETAENVAKRYKVDRKRQEEFAVQSHKKATAARAGGKLKDEIIAITQGNLRVEEDGCIRPDTTADALAGLEPAFDKTGTVTAGTSSPLTDGAAAVLVCSEDYAKAHGLKPLAKLKSISVFGCSPDIMGMGPVGATKKALDRAKLSIKDIDIIELNEAFASQALAVMAEAGIPLDKTNLDGGALALGHPLGATGARITGKAASLLKREGKKFALSTQCIGGGQGIATILEAV